MLQTGTALRLVLVEDLDDDAQELLDQGLVFEDDRRVFYGRKEASDSFQTGHLDLDDTMIECISKYLQELLRVPYYKLL